MQSFWIVGRKLTQFRYGVAPLALILLAGCGTLAETEAPRQRDLEEASLALEITYDEVSFGAELSGRTLTLLLPDGRKAALSRVRAASGTKYEADGMLVWMKGDEALVEVDGQTYANGRIEELPETRIRTPWNIAYGRGVTFRGVGQEPGWFVEVEYGRRLQLVTDYGQHTVVVVDPVVEVDGNTTIYHGSEFGGDSVLRVVITPEPCQDTMKGNGFPATVEVTLNGETLRGCGRRVGP